MDPNNQVQKKILVVEDDQMLRTALVETLGQQGYLLFTAENGEEGLKIIYEQKPDLVYLDINMPVMDGVTMLKKMREDQALDKISVVMLTNLNDSSKINETLNLHVVRYFVKSDIKLEAIVETTKIILTS